MMIGTIQNQGALDTSNHLSLLEASTVLKSI